MLPVNWTQLTCFLFTVIELAVLLAAGLRDWIDFGVIIGILMLNATVGWYQEKQAADVVASLKGDIALRSTVVRDGQEQEIRARELVPGDIVSFLSPIESIGSNLMYIFTDYH
jgi:magnesium-transporting ATPase (P-type)